MLDPEIPNTELLTTSRNHNNLFVHKDIRKSQDYVPIWYSEKVWEFDKFRLSARIQIEIKIVKFIKLIFVPFSFS